MLPWRRPALATPSLPKEGFDLRYMEQQQTLAKLMSRSILRLERRVTPQGLNEGDADLLLDGAATILPDGRLLTTAAYMGESVEVKVVYDRVTIGVARLERRLNLKEGSFAILRFVGALPEGLGPIAAISLSPFPEKKELPLVTASEAGVSHAGLSQLAATYEGETLYAAGTRRDGVPLFDHHFRLVALCERVTPDMLRSVLIPTHSLGAALALPSGATGSLKKPAPRPEGREAGGP